MVDFQIVNGKLKIDPYTLTVRVFHDIWEYDKSESKANASNILLYVFHMNDITQKNPLRNLDEKAKVLMSKHNAFGDREYKFAAREQELIDEATKWYQILNKNSVQRLSHAIDRKIDQVTDYLMNPENDIKKATQLDEQIEVLTKFEKLLASRKKTNDHVHGEIEKMKVKGATERSPLMKGLV